MSEAALQLIETQQERIAHLEQVTAQLRAQVQLYENLVYLLEAQRRKHGRAVTERGMGQ